MRGVILLVPHCFLYITNGELRGEAFQISMWDRQWNLLTVQALGYCTWGPVRGTSESAGHTLSRNHFLGPLGLHVQGLGHHGVNFTSHLRKPSPSWRFNGDYNRQCMLSIIYKGSSCYLLNCPHRKNVKTLATHSNPWKGGLLTHKVRRMLRKHSSNFETPWFYHHHYRPHLCGHPIQGFSTASHRLIPSHVTSASACFSSFLLSLNSNLQTWLTMSPDLTFLII